MITNYIANMEVLQPLTELIPVHEGFSDDLKFVAVINGKKKFFIRACNLSKSAQKQEEMSVMKVLLGRGVSLPEPTLFQEVPEMGYCLQVFEFVEGITGDYALKELSEQEQYLEGVAAGKSLALIHELHREKPLDWLDFRGSKYRRYVSHLHIVPNLPFSLVNLLDYVAANISKLANRPTVFLHDDFHPANLSFNQGKFNSVLDFERFDWGDPYHDFFKVSFFTRDVSIPFSIGQFHGYFNGEPSEEFWELYCLYAAMNSISDLVWSAKVTPHLIHTSFNRVETVMKDHLNFTTNIPTWYQPIPSYMTDLKV